MLRYQSHRRRAVRVEAGAECHLRRCPNLRGPTRRRQKRPNVRLLASPAPHPWAHQSTKGTYLCPTREVRRRPVPTSLDHLSPGIGPGGPRHPTSAASSWPPLPRSEAHWQTPIERKARGRRIGEHAFESRRPRPSTQVGTQRISVFWESRETLSGTWVNREPRDCSAAIVSSQGKQGGH
jgi:hypothetical protein